jgi:hypothetical protein
LDLTWIAWLIIALALVILGLAIRGVWRSARHERSGGETIPAAMVVVEDLHDHHHDHAPHHDPGGHPG